MKLLVILLIVIQIGCAGFPPSRISTGQAAGAGAIAGAATQKVVERVKEVFTPKYPLYLPPHEICDISSSSVVVTCYLIPCEKDCKRSVGWPEWAKNNPSVLTVRQSAIPAAIEFCKKNEEACVEQIGEYAGQTIVIVD